MIIAQNNAYNAGHTVFTLFQFCEPSFLYGEPDVITYGLYNNSCPLWHGTDKEQALLEYDKLTKPAW